MISTILIIISLILDGLLTNIFPYMMGNLSFLTPLLTVICIIIIYPFYKKNLKKYYILSFLIGIIYDLLYTNLFLINGVLFFIIALITRYIYKNLRISSLSLTLYICLIIVLYETLLATIFIVFNMIPFSITSILYKIVNSLVINIIYGEILYYIVKTTSKRHKKIKINR